MTKRKSFEAENIDADNRKKTISGANLPDRAVVQMRTACNKTIGSNPFASRHKVEEEREK